MKRNFEKKRIDALTGPIILADSKSKIISHSTLPSHLYLESLRILSNGNRYLMGPHMLLTHDIWLKVRGLINPDDKKVHEDIDLSLKITKAGGIIGYDKKLIVFGSARRMIHRPESFFIEYPSKNDQNFR